MLTEEARDLLREILPPILSIKDAAAALKVSDITIRRLIWEGQLDAYQAGSIDWEINRSSVIEYLSRTSNL